MNRYRFLLVAVLAGPWALIAAMQAAGVPAAARVDGIADVVFGWTVVVANRRMILDGFDTIRFVGRSRRDSSWPTSARKCSKA
jgi:hypothetical protein